ncbi:hypothetical protein [Caminibacter pacificus]|uniref:Uncharacterized protein n=1 Tax=Caminibacter pacificus TaxID=1424653 RepID=A0AAJ4RC92_9BACT|nr:hypothetical protein [Caminibacter pacificus]QCI28955.1 hypothetical protein C6V80_08220 [Caminibacter pacificus]ROR39547.1 hypothetical protein EDC58_1489 [Caminibacter pacificus]
MKKIVFLFFSFIFLFGMSPKKFFELQIKSLEISLQGSKDYLKCLERKCTSKELDLLNKKYYLKQQKLYKSYNISESEAALYYTKHKRECDEYYRNNPDIVEMIDDLQNEIENVHNQIDSYRGGK